MKLGFEKVSERDVDFVIMRAFAEIPSFIHFFVNLADGKNTTVLSVEHSFTDVALGESDITVVLNVGNRKKALLIENKIDAEAMPEQYLRYCKRGEKGVETGKYDEYDVFLLAPSKYLLSNQEAAKYTNRITYEDLYEFFNEQGRVFDAEIIKCALAKQDNGYTVCEVPAITLFWKKLYEYINSVSRVAEMYPVQRAKGAKSMWPRFKSVLKKSELYYKADKGVCDLQFNGKAHDGEYLRSVVNKYKSDDMHWQKTGGSLSLRIKTVKIDFNESFDEHIDDVEKILRAIEKLTNISIILNDEGLEL